MLEKERYELLKESSLFCRHPEKLNKFLENQNTVNNVNSIDFKRLKLLFRNNSHWYTFCKTDRRIIKDMLQYHRSASAINSIDLEKLQIVVLANHFSIYIISLLISDENALDAINLINIERLKMLINYDKSYSWFIMGEILRSRNAVNAINSLEEEKINLLDDECKLDGPSFAKIFANPRNVEAIISMDIEKLKILLKSGKLCLELLEKEDSINASEIELLLKDDKYYHCLKTPKNLKDFYRVEIEKLKLLSESDLFDYEAIVCLIKTRGVIKAVNSLHIEKLSLLLKFKEVDGPRMIRSSEHLATSGTRAVYPTSLDQTHRNFVFQILMDWRVVNRINHLGNERLTLLLRNWRGSDSNDQFYFDIMDDMRYLIRSPDILKLVISVDIEKLEILLERYSIRWTTFILQDQKIFDFIESVNLEKLRIMIAMIEYDDFIDIFDFYEWDVRKNLNFAIALYKAGKIRSVTCSFLHNNDVANDAIIKAFPEGFPIDQMLVPSSIPERLVPSLKNLSIVASIAAINQPLNEMES